MLNSQLHFCRYFSFLLLLYGSFVHWSILGFIIITITRYNHNLWMMTMMINVKTATAVKWRFSDVCIYCIFIIDHLKSSYTFLFHSSQFSLLHMYARNILKYYWVCTLIIIIKLFRHCSLFEIYFFHLNAKKEGR